ncbi:hypothetical protein MLAC_10640 [Mycobacterium lacus]|uniref:Rieske domain-containing protein n=1 Tax=Mycobacterium lacus TaxID=169765 RepID=A0A7I7NGS9_9MYCO|nr:hypothetical protein MLAC_10640 [Mycobacterium lacus]
MLTRASDGSVKAFDNVCLHRQSQVVSGCGTAKRFTCPYHAWTYDNTGRLAGLPGREGCSPSAAGWTSPGTNRNG